MTCVIDFGSSFNIPYTVLFIWKTNCSFLKFHNTNIYEDTFLCSIKGQRRVLCGHNVSRMV